jgi:hypothetical protein
MLLILLIFFLNKIKIQEKKKIKRNKSIKKKNENLE